MPFYEVVYEGGSHSVAMYEDDEEALRALREHHRRATVGEAAQEGLDRPAERIVKVFVYDEHPGMYRSDGVVPEDEAMEAVKAGGTVEEMRARLSDLVYPLVSSGPHESNYKMEEGRELEGWDEV